MIRRGNRTEREAARRRWLARAAALVLAWLPGSAAAAPERPPGGGMRELVPSRTISARDKPRVHALTAAPEAGSWEIELRIGNAQALDLDLAVFSEDPEKNPYARPRCVSESTYDIERCRVLGAKSGPLWAKVTVVGGNGASLYTIWGKPLNGAVLGETELTASDAKPLALGETRTSQFVNADPPEMDTLQHAYEVRLSPEAQKHPLVVSCTGTQAAATMMLSVFDARGKRIGQSGPDTTHQLRLDPSGSDRLYVLVRLTPTRSIFSRPQYELLMASTAESIPLRMRAESIVMNDDGPQAYLVELEGSNLAAIVLESRQYQLQVTDPSETKYPVREMLGGQIVRIGVPFEKSPFVLRELPKPPGKLRVEVQKRSTTAEGYRSGWTLRILNPLKPESYLISFPLEDVESWGEWTQPKKGRLSDGGQKVYALGAITFGRASGMAQQSAPLPRALTAWLLGSGAETLNLAVCNRYGQVLSIGSRTVEWDVPRDTTDLYLVIFPRPWSAKQEGGEFEVRINVGRPSSSLK